MSQITGMAETSEVHSHLIGKNVDGENNENVEKLGSTQQGNVNRCIALERDEQGGVRSRLWGWGGVGYSPLA